MAETDGLAPGVEEVLYEIASFDRLEVVRVVWGARDRTWSLDELTAELRSTVDRVLPAVAEVLELGLIEEVAPRAYRAASGHPKAEHVHALLTVYRVDPLIVMRNLTEAAIQRIRASAAHTFAEAFLLRKPKEPGDA